MATLGRPRDRRKEHFWRQTLERFARSGLSAARFCQRHQLPLPSFWAWKRTLRLRDQPPQTSHATAPHSTPTPAQIPALPVFVPLQVQPHADTAPAQPTAAVLEVLLPNGLRLRVGQHFDPDTLQRLLPLLRGASC
jgi:hypothetical protein